MIPFAASASVTLPGRRFWRSQIVSAIFAWRAAPSRAASKCVCPGMARFYRSSRCSDTSEVGGQAEKGDTVVAIGTASGRAKKTGKTVKNEWVHVLKYNNGKLVFFQEYSDTAAEVLGLS